MNADHREMFHLLVVALSCFTAGAWAMRHLTKQRHAATVGELRERAP